MMAYIHRINLTWPSVANVTDIPKNGSYYIWAFVCHGKQYKLTEPMYCRLTVINSGLRVISIPGIT